MFLDASAIVAIPAREPVGASLLGKIMNTKEPVYYSSTVAFEAVIALARQRKTAVYGEHAPTPKHLIDEVQAVVSDFFGQVGAVEFILPSGFHDSALAAAKTYGRFVGHPAKLNFGDCFSYAAARMLQAPLLFVGDDFSRTDIEVA